MARTVFGPKDALKQVLITGATVSPDGDSVVYTKRTIEKGKERSRLWRVPIGGGRPERLTTAAASDTDPRFSPDGRSVLLSLDRRQDDDDPKKEPKGQLWVLPVAGGEPRRLAPLPEGGGSGIWSPDGSRIVCLGSSGTQRFLVGKADKQVARHITEFTWRLDGDGIVINSRARGWCPLRAVASPFASRRRTPRSRRRSGLRMAHGSGSSPIAVTRLGTRGTDALVDALLGQRIASSTGGLRRLRDRGELGRPARIVFTGLSERSVPWRNVELFVAEGAGRAVRRLAFDETISLSGMIWSELAPSLDDVPPIPLGGGRWVLMGHELGTASAYLVDGGGGLTALTDRRLEVAGVVEGGGRLVAVACEEGDAAELYELDPDAPGEARRITRDGARWFAPFHHAVTEEVSVPRRRVRDVQAWLTRATGRRGADRRPMILHVHGGPYGATGPTPLFEDLILAETGFHVLAPNPAGSTGFGEYYARSLFGRWGVPDTADLMASIDWAVAEGIADPDRIGVLGLSYGGYMVHHLLATHPGRFKAAVSENPFTSAFADLGAGDSGHLMAEETGVGPWPDDMDGWLAISPAMKIHRNRAPLLLLQSDSDVRCPPVHSEIAFAILRPRGVTVEMVRYPEESHVMLVNGRPDRRVDRLERIVGWFSEYL